MFGKRRYKKKSIEKNTLKVHNSRKIYIPVYIMIFVLIGTVIFIKYNGLKLNNYVWWVVIIFVILAIKYTEIHRFTNWYKITPDSLVHKQGILNKKIKNLDLSAISDIDIYQNFWQRMLGYGNISVRLFSEVSHTEIKNINDPVKFGNILEKSISLKGGLE